MTTNWQLRRVSDNTVDEDFESLRLTDAFNRFARSAEVTLDDPDSVKTSEYPRGTLVELEVAVPGFFDFTRRFAGFVADYQQDRNSTSLTILSHDFWIRKRTVNRNFEQTRLETILQTLIEDLTPLSYNAANVDLQSNPEISREWKGEQLETVLDEIGEISGGNEDYGANNDLEFFYQRREFESSPRNFGQGEYSSVEWSQDGKRDVNRAIIEYGEDDTAGVQIREDAQSQLDLQDKIGSDDPVVIEQRKAYPEITDPDVAADKAKQLLNGKATLLTGEVETWEAFAVTPGMVADVVDPDTGTDGEFVVAEITYRWPSEEPETIVTVADKSVATSEELINLSDDVTRVDLRDTDANAPIEQNIPTQIGALVEPTVLIGGVEAASVRLTNTARNLIRDGWRGVGNLDISEIAIGDSNANLSRTNTSLENQTNFEAATETLSGDKSVEYDVSIGDDTTREVGLLDSSGNLLVRGIFTADQFAGTESGTTVSLTVSNNLENDLGVLTDIGQESMRDIVADNAPVLPQFYAYGSGGSVPQESDIALETELARQDLDKIVVQSANTTSEFNQIVSESNPDPTLVDSNRVTSKRVCLTREAEDAVTLDGAVVATTTGDLSGESPEDGNGQGVRFRELGDSATWEFSWDYAISEDGWDFGLRYATDEDLVDPDFELEWSINGTRTVEFSPFTDGTDFPSWVTGLWSDSIGFPATPAVEAGETVTVEAEVTAVGSSTTLWYADVIAPFDKSYSYNFDNNTTTVDGDNYLDGPELFAPEIEITFEEIRARRDVTQANINSTWDDVSNNQYIDLAIIDDAFERTNNSQTASVTVSEADADTSIQSKVGLSRHGPTRDATPREGYLAQEIQAWELTANPDSITQSGIGTSETRAVFPAGGDLSGTTLQEAGQLGGSDELLSRSIFSPIPESGVLDSTTTIIASENTQIL